MTRKISVILTCIMICTMNSITTFAQTSDYMSLEPTLFLSVDIGGVLLSPLIGFVLALALAFAITGSMIASMNTARPQTKAVNYIRQNSLDITKKQDKFMYANTVSRELSNNDDDHDDDDDDDD